MDWILYLIVNQSTAGPLIAYQSEKPTTLKECLSSVESFKVHIPQGGDAETAIAFFCSKKMVKADLK